MKEVIQSNSCFLKKSRGEEEGEKGRRERISLLVKTFNELPWDVQDTKIFTTSNGHIETNVLEIQAEQVEAPVTAEYVPANSE